MSIDEEKPGLILQEDDIFYFGKEGDRITEIPKVVFVIEDNILRVNKETRLAISLISL